MNNLTEIESKTNYIDINIVNNAKYKKIFTENKNSFVNELNEIMRINQILINANNEIKSFIMNIGDFYNYIDNYETIAFHAWNKAFDNLDNVGRMKYNAGNAFYTSEIQPSVIDRIYSKLSELN